MLQSIVAWASLLLLLLLLLYTVVTLKIGRGLITVYAMADVLLLIQVNTITNSCVNWD